MYETHTEIPSGGPQIQLNGTAEKYKQHKTQLPKLEGLGWNYEWKIKKKKQWTGENLQRLQILKIFYVKYKINKL